MGNCGGKPIAKETIDESQKSHQQIPKALIRSEVRKSVRHVDLRKGQINKKSILKNLKFLKALVQWKFN